MTATALATALADFNRGEAFFDHLAEEVLVEFPYGPTLGLPAHIAGKAAVHAHLSRVQAGGLTIQDPTIQEVTPTRYLVESTGVYPRTSGSSVNVLCHSSRSSTTTPTESAAFASIGTPICSRACPSSRPAPQRLTAQTTPSGRLDHRSSWRDTCGAGRRRSSSTAGRVCVRSAVSARARSIFCAALSGWEPSRAGSMIW